MSPHHPAPPPDALLAAALPLPARTVIAYARFVVAAPVPDALELARRTLVARHPPATPLSDAVLAIVHAGSLYAFKISTTQIAPADADLLGALSLEGLAVLERSFFIPPPVSVLLPTPDKRAVLSYFYDAVRTRVIDDIAAHSASCSVRRQVKRFKGGFLMSQISPSSDWQYTAITRPLVFCQLQVHFSYYADGTPYQLLIHPTLMSTPFLDIARSLPLPAGTPITLLPYGTPAYYLASYTGPTTGLVKQFETSLQGLGAGQWATTDKSSTEYPSPYVDATATQNASQSPTFIIGWIKVENKQGEDKGIIIIYPTHLCLSYVPNTCKRAPLDYIPELPAPLQPSPQGAPALPSMSSISPELSGLSTPSTSLNTQRPILFSSPTSESLHSFRALTLSKTSELRQVATEVGGYVDAVARERERERERLKRERENGISTSPRLVRASATTPASISAPTPSSVETSTSGGSALPAGNISLIIPPNPASTNTQANRPLQPVPPIIQSASNQNFYPSPPQGTPHAVAGPTSPVADDNSMNVSSTSGTVPSIVYPPSDAHSELPHSDTTIPANPANVLTSVPPPSAPQQSYDLYGMDNSSSGYMGLDMDMGMDFGLGDLGLSFGMNMGMGIDGMNSMSMSMEGIEMGAAQSSGVASRGGGGGDMDFDNPFTDDDFSFFDRPARAPPPPAPPTDFRLQTGVGGTSSSAPGSLMSPPTSGYIEDATSTGASMAQNAQQMWTPGPGPEAMTPAHVHEPNSHATPNKKNVASAPTTPRVQLSTTTSSPDVTFSHGLPTPTPSLFEPIPFAAYHRTADGKYANGKFALANSTSVALPSPPAEEGDRDVSMENEVQMSCSAGHVSLPSSPRRSVVRPKAFRSFSGMSAGIVSSGWRLRYDAATDPRIGVVRKLIGVKRKPGAHDIRDPPRTVPWTAPPDGAACADWQTSMAIQPALRDRDSPDDLPSDVESDEDEEDAVNDEEEDEDTLDRSRPTTPPPSYLPLGPSLLHTQFEHAQLLALSTPLRPPGAAILDPTSLPPDGVTGVAGIPPPPVPSVPTPVSPAATAGAASERGKNLEGAARVLASEIVENAVWAETWRAAGSSSRSCTSGGVWASDKRAVEALLGGVIGLRTGLGYQDVFGVDPQSVQRLQPLEAPMVSIGKGEAIINLRPTAIRFWEKLGLDPKGGRKDVAAFVLFEDGGVERQTFVENWLANLRNIYQGKHFGNMNLGTSSVCSKDGIIPLKFDGSFRKTLASFAETLKLVADPPIYVIFLVLPFAVMSLSSPVFRQVISGIRRMPNFGSHNLFFQFIPEQHLFSGLEKTSGYESALDQVAFSVYDRIMIPVDRLRLRRPETPTEESVAVRKYFHSPSFTLARPLQNQVSYVRSAHASLDVLDRYTLLHVGYHLTACGKWTIAVCVDQRGEAYEMGVWLTQPPEQEGDAEGTQPEEYVVRRVWEFATQFAKKTNVEWRIVFARLGVMPEKELVAWSGLLSARVTSSHEQPPLHHTLACVVPDAGWSFMPSKSTSSSMSSNPSRPTQTARSTSSWQSGIYTDVSSLTYSIFPTTRMPISVPPSQNGLGLSQLLVEEPSSPASASASSPHPHPHQAGDAPGSDILYPSIQVASTPVASATVHADSTPFSVNTSLPHPVTILPLLSSYLVRVPSATTSSNLTTIGVHLLRTFHSHPQAARPRPPDDRSLLEDVTRNYYDLAVLAKVRHRLDGVGGHKGLPLHLAAVDAVRMALDRDWERMDGVAEV